jgi:hypothetical protein
MGSGAFVSSARLSPEEAADVPLGALRAWVAGTWAGSYLQAPVAAICPLRLRAFGEVVAFGPWTMSTIATELPKRRATAWSANYFG